MRRRFLPSKEAIRKDCMCWVATFNVLSLLEAVQNFDYRDLGVYGLKVFTLISYFSDCVAMMILLTILFHFAHYIFYDYGNS